jgi:nucleoside-diphosphate-sugar epimerase
MTKQSDLTVAVTGPTGTFGFGLMPLLQEDDSVSRIVGIARRPFDPQERGWSKMVYRQGDVRDQDALTEAFAGADVVVHLAFLIVGGSPETTHAINIEGTLNAFRAAAAAGAERFVYASSVAAYGFHADNPVGMTEEWHVRPADRLFYAQQKAELEQLLSEESEKHPEIDLYLLRPPIVLGPDAVGGKVEVPAPLVPLGKALRTAVRRLPVPVVVPDIDLQLIHQDDVGQALLQCVLAAGAPGAYNIAADDVVSVVDVARELGFVPLPFHGGSARAAARVISKVPFLPPQLQWIEAASHPAIMDTTRARTELGWKPQWSAIESLRDTLGD